MTPGEFITWVEKNAARVQKYKKGGDGTGGECDCIGLIIGAWRLSGNRWAWTHGSNYTARYLVNSLAADQPLNVGDLVFKAREQGESGYALPDTYKGHHDKRDYYHVGVVTSKNPLQIKHCTSVQGGIKVDTRRGQWKYSAQFKYIKEDTPMSEKNTNVEAMPSKQTATVYAENGKPVNLRKGPGTKYGLENRISSGTEVEVLSVSDGWAVIKHGNRQGYMSTDFLLMHNTTAGEAQGNNDNEDIQKGLETAVVALAAAESALYEAKAHIQALQEMLSAVG